eukprot:3316959-Prymnesium_polylepis.1
MFGSTSPPSFCAVNVFSSPWSSASSASPAASPSSTALLTSSVTPLARCRCFWSSRISESDDVLPRGERAGG